MTQPGLRREPDDSFDLYEYLSPIWRRKWLIALLVIVAAGGAYGIARSHRTHAAPQYVASTRVYFDVADPVDLVGNQGTPAPPSGPDMEDIATLFTGQAITQQAYKLLGLQVGRAGSVQVAPLASGAAVVLGTSIIVVTATSPTPVLAARLANAYVQAFLGARRADEAAAAKGQANTVQAELNSLPSTPANAAERQQFQVTLALLRTQERDPSAGAEQINVATPPSSPTAPPAPRSPAFDAAVAAFVALLLGIGIALATSMLDRRLVRVSAVEASYGRPVLSVLPHVPLAAPFDDGRAVLPEGHVETLRALRVSLRLSAGKGAPQSVLVTSAVPGEGKSTLARNLALVHADAGDSVLLIDADLRRPSVPALLGIQSDVGLTHVLIGDSTLEEAVVHVAGRDAPAPSAGSARANGAAGSRSRRAATVKAAADVLGHGANRTARGRLDVLCHGDVLENPVPLLASDAMGDLLAAAGERYDIVIIDSAPLLAVTDTVPLIQIADAVLLVARVGVTTRDAAERATEAADRVPDANVLGVVANDVRDRYLDSGYGDMYSGRYGYSSPGGRADRSTAARAG